MTFYNIFGQKMRKKWQTLKNARKIPNYQKNATFQKRPKKPDGNADPVDLIELHKCLPV